MCVFGFITANASDAEERGGDGGSIDMYGIDITNTAALSVNAGNGTDAVTSYGGNGGAINLQTDLFAAPSNSGSFSYSFGTGVTENGIEGSATSSLLCEGSCNTQN